jgi:hypothetical protein
MTKQTKILLNEKEVKVMMELFGNEFLRLGDNDALETPHGKSIQSVYNKIVKGKNKNGIWYLWQLKDSSKDVTDDNILPEWRLK